MDYHVHQRELQLPCTLSSADMRSNKDFTIQNVAENWGFKETNLVGGFNPSEIYESQLG